MKPTLHEEIYQLRVVCDAVFVQQFYRILARMIRRITKTIELLNPDTPSRADATVGDHE